MDALRNHMRIEALRAGGRSVSSAKGVITSYDPNRYAAKVFLMPEGAFPEETGEVVESGWIPIQTQWSGNGWGLYCPPSPGDQVAIEFIEGDTSSPEIVGRVFDLAHLPLNVPSGECWLVHASGAFLKLTNDGKLSINSDVEIDATGPTINITATSVANADAPTINITGSSVVNVTAPTINLGSSGEALAALVLAAAWEWITTHTHANSGGTGNSGLPNGVPTSGVLTSVVKAG